MIRFPFFTHTKLPFAKPGSLSFTATTFLTIAFSGVIYSVEKSSHKDCVHQTAYYHSSFILQVGYELICCVLCVHTPESVL